MIFVTVGTRDGGFDRLVRGVDAIASEFQEPIRAQIGDGDYIPENLDWFRFTSEEEVDELYRAASVVVAHAGAGTLLTARSYDKPTVVLPRRRQHGDHNDDHQLELANALRDRPEVFVIRDPNELKPVLDRARSQPDGSTARKNSLVPFLAEYLDDIEP